MAYRRSLPAKARARDKPTCHPLPPTRIKRVHRAGAGSATQSGTARRYPAIKAARSRGGKGRGALTHMSPAHVMATSHAALSDCTTTSSSRVSFQCDVWLALS